MLIFVFGDINGLILYEALEWHENKKCFLGKCNISKKRKDERNSLNKGFVKAIKEPWKVTGNLTFYFEWKTAFFSRSGERTTISKIEMMFKAMSTCLD